jgi:alpha-beta hydrolase superfamily lysophospholipase
LNRKAAAALPYKEEDVTFQSGGFALTGTLRLPLTKGRHSAIFLLQGSGDADREAESFYADYFARNGIATLVYDKRGTGSSGGDYRDQSFDDFAADALAGVHYRRSEKRLTLSTSGCAVEVTGAW